ncbi:MAG: anthranilate synthase component I [Salinivirgaceae bacterium]|nr:MAG: anthranilate synthase component I [Salinivirgaceae bacterium]
MIQLQLKTKTILADTLSPVSMYLKFRDIYPNAILLESNDYQGGADNYSFICLEPIASFVQEQNDTKVTVQNKDISPDFKGDVVERLQQFIDYFKIEGEPEALKLNGLFGYTAYDAVRNFEKIEIRDTDPETQIPEIYYQIYRFVIAVNHYKNTATIMELIPEGDKPRLQEIKDQLLNRSFAAYPFKSNGSSGSNMEDEDYKQLVSKAKHHCKIGDTFQLVLSRRFYQSFEGDEFNVYRALRSVNPSPYLFYFDYGNFRLFGSSPESQLVVKDKKATIVPIAGTVKRTGNDAQDRELATSLYNDEKENAEHVMLVDLARNDLSRFATDIAVEKFKEIQYYSHVLHMVSTVTGTIQEGVTPLEMLGKSYPAGTLTGAPKVKAMELISKYENVNRSFYGGAIGQISFNGDINHAIIIRSALAKNHKLYYQAGAGIVIQSEEEKELEEVYNKIGAIRKAIELAQNINQ